MSIYLVFLLIGVIGWAIAGPPPTSLEYREARRDHRARAQAAAQAARAARQTRRRQTFAAHPMLYWAIAWLTPVLLLALLTAL